MQFWIFGIFIKGNQERYFELKGNILWSIGFIESGINITILEFIILEKQIEKDILGFLKFKDKKDFSFEFWIYKVREYLLEFLFLIFWKYN